MGCMDWFPICGLEVFDPGLYWNPIRNMLICTHWFLGAHRSNQSHSQSQAQPELFKRSLLFNHFYKNIVYTVCRETYHLSFRDSEVILSSLRLSTMCLLVLQVETIIRFLRLILWFSTVKNESFNVSSIQI